MPRSRSEARRAGAKFELAVRKVLEDKGYVVCKWHNQVDMENNCIVPAKNKFSFGRALSVNFGFPDFIAFKKDERLIIGVEAKMRGYLKPVEKEKMKWYKFNGVFESVWVAYESNDGSILFRELF